MSGGSSGLVPIAIASPSPLQATSTLSSPAPAKNSNTIILVIFLIAIIVFCVFLFTKLNTQDKRIKQLESNQESMLKLLPAIAQRVGVRVDEKGEIEMMGEDEDSEENEEECQREQMESDSKENHPDHDEKLIFVQRGGGHLPAGLAPSVPASVFARMFAQQAAFLPPGVPQTTAVVEEPEKGLGGSEKVDETPQDQGTQGVPASEATTEVPKAQDSVDKVN